MNKKTKHNLDKWTGIKRTIAQKFLSCPSYFRWSTKAVADYFGWNIKTVARVKEELTEGYTSYRERAKA